MKVFVGDKEVIDSGSILLVDNESPRFFLTDTFIVRLRFSVDLHDKTNRTWTKVENGEYVIDFKNYPYEGSIANKNPVEIGINDGKRIFLGYYVSSLGNEEHCTRVVNYTFSQLPIKQGVCHE